MKVKLSKYAKMSGVSVRTLWRRIKEGTLNVEYSSTGRVFINLENEQVMSLNVCIYARVSSSENKDNLERQKERLVSYCNAKGYKVCRIVTEVGSGLNDERKKLESILTDKSINLIVVEHKDRLSRFGFKYFEYIFKLFGTDIEVVNLTKEEDFQTELTCDLISIIHHFSMKMYSNRRKELDNLKKILQDNDNN